MSKIQMALSQAEQLATKIKSCLEPYCERIEIAGSIRRQKSTIGDIEIVCIPRRQPDLFGNLQASLLDPHLDDLVAKDRLIRGKQGDRYKQFFIPSIPDLQLDLFVTDPECWPVIFAIRTGSAEFSRRLVTQKSKGGLLPSHLHIRDGRAWNGILPVELQTERDFLELCDGWVEPQERS